MVRMNNAHDIVLDGFKFDGTNQNYYGEGIEIGGASHDITIKNSEITMEGNTNGPGYQCPNGPCMLGMGTDYPAYNLLISHNKIHHLGPGGAYAIYFHSRDSTFEYNEVYNLDEYGVHFYATADHPEPTDRNVFRGNYIHDINGPCVLFASGGDSNTFYNNVLARCGLLNHRGTDGLQLGCYGDRASTNNTVYNNTFYGNAGNAIRVCGSGHKLQNNILFGNGADVMGLSGATNITMDHNLCPAANGGCTVVTSQSASQLFVNAASGDFHLVAGSAAIAQGIPIATVTTDIAGTPRRLGTPYDLGAYVYSSGPAPDPAPTALRVLAITP
jgi:parallel beta-helix repeat protein